MHKGKNTVLVAVGTVVSFTLRDRERAEEGGTWPMSRGGVYTAIAFICTLYEKIQPGLCS